MNAVMRLLYARRRRLQQQAEHVPYKDPNKAIRALLADQGKTPSADSRSSFTEAGRSNNGIDDSHTELAPKR